MDAHVVDDDRSNAAEDALLARQQRQPPLLLVDWLLPGMAGLEALAVRLAVEEKRVAVVQARDRAEAALRERTRLEGVLLAAGTVQHYLGNQLSTTMGYAEMLANDPRLPADLRDLAAEAVEGVVAARQTLLELSEITRIEIVEGLGGPPVLDLALSRPLAARLSQDPHARPAMSPDTVTSARDD